jgi:hypothetical protein
MSRPPIVFWILIGILLVKAQPQGAGPEWAPVGHQISALIAQNFLSRSAFGQANYFLSKDRGQLDLVSEWADQIRNDPEWKWSAPLHYIDVEDWKCDYVKERDCSDEMCVSEAIKNYTRRLTNALDFETQVSALKFLVHFHSDVHDPMHVGFRTDEGGRKLKGTFFDEMVTLHEIWDNRILTRRSRELGGEEEYVKWLLNQLETTYKEEARNWTICEKDYQQTEFPCSSQWANESAQLACECYRDASGKPIINDFVIGVDYYEKFKTVVDVQILKSGVRLASTLNSLWK